MFSFSDNRSCHLFNRIYLIFFIEKLCIRMKYGALKGGKLLTKNRTLTNFGLKSRYSSHKWT